MLSLQNLKSLHLPLTVSQQLAELRYLQGRYELNPNHNPDLLAGMAVKSRLVAVNAMAQTADSPVSFNYGNALAFLQTLDHPVTGRPTSGQNPGLQSRPPEDSNCIQQLHRQLNPQGGHWRTVKLTINRRDQANKKLLIPITQASIAAAIEQALDQLQQALDTGIEPLLIIPLFTLQLMQLFPFLDGNRRVTLLLARQLLNTHGYSVVNYVDLESEFSATERLFYRSLHQASASNEANVIPWLSYWWVLIKRLYLRLDRQIQHANISPGRGSKTALVERFVKQQRHTFRFSDVCQAFPTISPDMVRTILRSLRDNQVIRSEGKGRAALWVKLEAE